MTISTTNNNAGTGAIVFGNTADNTDFTGKILTFEEDITSNIVSPNLFLSGTGTMQFNSTGGSLTLNGENTMEGTLTRSNSNGGTVVVNINANQNAIKKLNLWGADILTLNIHTDVTDVTFLSTDGTWAATLNIVGFKNYVIKFGTTLTQAQLDAITLNGVAVSAGYFTQVDGKIVESAAANTENNTLSEVVVYPNPAQDDLNISAPVGSEITITNIAGIQVKSLQADSKNTKLSVSGLNSGIYIVKVVSEGKSYVTKVVVQ